MSKYINKYKLITTKTDEILFIIRFNKARGKGPDSKGFITKK